MLNEATVTDIIYKAIASLNDELGEGEQVPLALDTALFGPEARIDSLALVSIIVDVESEVAARIGRGLQLADDEAMSSEVSPFASVRSLRDHVLRLAGNA